MWVGEPPGNRKKFEISKMKPTLAGSGGKTFRGNGRRRSSIVGQPNVQRSVETGPSHIVQFRRKGSGRGGLSKNWTLPHAQIWGPTTNFDISPCGYAKGLQIPKIWRKNLGPFSRYEFSKFWRKIAIFRVRGILNSRKFHSRCVLVPPKCVPNLVRIG